MSLRRALSIALAFQLGLAVLTWWPTDRSETRTRPLIDLTRETIDRVAIQQAPTEAAEAQPGVVLERENGEWRIASSYGYPADAVKVTGLLDKLLGLTIRAPVATTPSSHNSLSVGEREYGRRITLRSGEQERVLILGAAASNRVNVRFADDDTVYVAAGAAEWSFSDRAESYRPATYLDVAPESLATISVRNAHGAFSLTRTESGWSLSEPASDLALDREASLALVSKLARLPMGNVASDTARPEHGFESGAAVIWTEASENESLVGGYSIGAASGSDRFVMAEGQAHVILLAETALAALLEARAEDLLAAPTEPDLEAAPEP